MPRSRTAALALVFRVLACVACASQPLAQLPDMVRLAPAMTVGEPVRYQLTSAAQLSQQLTLAPLNQEPSEPETRSYAGSLELTVVLQPTAVTDTSVTAALTIERLKLDDSDDQTPPLTLPLDLNLDADADADAEGAAPASAPTTRIVGVITGDGTTRVLEPGTLAALSAQAADRFGSDSIAASLVTPESLVGLLAPIFDADGAAPGQRVGFGWQREEEVLLPPVGAITLTRSYTLGEPTNAVARISGDLDAELMLAPTQGPLAPTLALREAAGELAADWNTAAGLLLERQSEQRLVTAWTLGPNQAVNTQTSRQTHRLLRD